MARGIPQWGYQSPINNFEYCLNRQRFNFTEAQRNELFSILRTNGLSVDHQTKRDALVAELQDAIDLYIYQIEEARKIPAQNDQVAALHELMQILDEIDNKLSGEMGCVREKLNCHDEIESARQAYKKISIAAKTINLQAGVNTKAKAKSNAQRRFATVLLLILSGCFDGLEESQYKKILDWCLQHKPEVKAYKLSELVSWAYEGIRI